MAMSIKNRAEPDCRPSQPCHTLSHRMLKDRTVKGHSQNPHHDTNDKLYLYSKVSIVNTNPKPPTSPGTEKQRGDFLQGIHQEGHGGTCATHMAVASGFMISAAGNRDMRWVACGRKSPMATGMGIQSDGSCLLEQNHGPTAGSSGPSLYHLKEAVWTGAWPPCPVIPPSLPGSHQLSLPEQQSPSLSLGLGSWVERVVRKGPWLVGPRNSM